jgi:uroporphyrinogen decarboxylase
VEKPALNTSHCVVNTPTTDQTPAAAQGSKTLLCVLRGEKTERIPFWFMRQAGRYLPEYRALRSQAGSFLSLCYDPALATEISLQPVRRFGMDGIILFSDILVIPDALGLDLAFKEGEGPILRSLESAAEIPEWEPERLHKHLAPVYETVSRIVEQAPADAALIGFAGAPWTVATYMVEGGASRDFSRVKSWAFAEPGSFQRLIDLLVEATAEYLSAQIKAGAEAVQLFDSWAGVLPEQAFARWCIAPVRAIVDRLKVAHPRIPVIGFPRGAGLGYVTFAREAGADAIGLDSAMPPTWAARELQPRHVVQGNLDPIMLLVGGKPMIEEARRILETLGAGPHVFNLGHGVLPETPPQNVAELAEFLRRWRR